jgi:sensor histidine kinase YesM
MKKLLLNIAFATLIATGVFIYLFFSETSKLPDILSLLDLFFWSIVAVNVVGWLLPFFSSRLNAVFSWKSSFGKRYFSGLIISMLAGYGTIALFGFGYFLFPANTVTYSSLIENNVDLLYKMLIVFGFLIIMYTLVDLAYFSYHFYAFEQIDSIRQTSDRLSLQLSALKKQLSPHFLFNSLNTASSLIYRNTNTAELFIRKLSDSYQKILDSVYYNLIPLSKELAIIDTYKFLMEIRYEQALKIDINIPEKLQNTSIPPLSLQLLVENAVKHNLINNDKPLYIEIYSDQGGYITVANNLNDKGFYLNINNELLENPERKSSGVGLQNIKDRYAFFSDRPVKIEKQKYFKVQLPIISDSQEELETSFFDSMKQSKAIIYE